MHRMSRVCLGHMGEGKVIGCPGTAACLVFILTFCAGPYVCQLSCGSSGCARAGVKLRVVNSGALLHDLQED